PFVYEPEGDAGVLSSTTAVPTTTFLNPLCYLLHYLSCCWPANKKTSMQIVIKVINQAPIPYPCQNNISTLQLRLSNSQHSSTTYSTFQPNMHHTCIFYQQTQFHIHKP